MLILSSCWPAEFSRDDDCGWACVGPDVSERNAGNSWKRWAVAHGSGLPYAAALDAGGVAVLDGADHILLASPPCYVYPTATATDMLR